MPWFKRGGIWIARVAPDIHVNESCVNVSCVFFFYHPGLICLRHAKNFSLAVDIYF